MYGEPFTTFKNIDDFKFAEKILKRKGLEYKHVISFRLEWITNDSNRSWYEVVYEPTIKSSNRYITTIGKEDADALNMKIVKS